jgi:hypothetical protein
MAFPEPRDRQIRKNALDALNLADDLVEWLSDHNPQRKSKDLLPIGAGDELSMLDLRRRTANLLRSSRVPVAAAVYGPSQTGKSLFVGRVLKPQDAEYSPLGRDENLGEPGYYKLLSFDYDLNPRCGAQEATAIVTRLTTKDRFESDVPAAFPVLLRPLSRAEWLRVLARGFRSECHLPSKAWEEDHMEALFVEISKAHEADRVDREWQMDLVDVYSYIRSQRDQDLRYRVAEPVFNGLLNRYPLSDEGYAEIAARLCWDGWPELTALFQKICRFLAKLKPKNSNTDELKEPKEPRVLIQWAAVRFLLDSQLSPEHESEFSRVMPQVHWNDITDRWEEGTYFLEYKPGQGPPQESLTTIQAAMLEMVVPVLPDRLTPEWRSVLENIDFLDIPGVRASAADGGGATMTSANEIEDQMRIVKRGKVFYLFEKYIDELQIQTLLMLLRGGNCEVRGLLKKYVNTWGELRYGKDVWPTGVRENPPALFLGMTGIDDEFDKEAPNKQLYHVRLGILADEVLTSIMNDFGGKGLPFTNVYPLRYPGTWDSDAVRRSTEHRQAEYLNKAGEIFLATERVQTFVADAGRRWDAAVTDGDGGASLIAEGFQQCTSADKKRSELEKSIEDARGRLTQISQNWIVDGDTNLDRAKREEVGETVVQWLTGNEFHIYEQIDAFEEALCLKKGDEFAISDLAEDVKRKSNRKRPEDLETLLHSNLRAFLQDWGTNLAPNRWTSFTRKHDNTEIEWLSSETFGKLTRYIVDYLCTPAVFDGLCQRVLRVVSLKGNDDEYGKKEARRKYVRLLLNDCFMNPGLDSTPLRSWEKNGHDFGLMEPVVLRWARRLPTALAQGAGDTVQIPPGNDELLKILDGA